MSNPKQVFGGITRKIFSLLRRKASRAGIHIASSRGKAVKDGVTIQWHYDARKEMLEVECHAPFWIDASRATKNLCQEIELTVRSARAA
jgi:hypothetical protein